MAKQTEGKVIVDIIGKMSQHSFFELFRWNTKTPQLSHGHYIVTIQEINVIFSTFQTFVLITRSPKSKCPLLLVRVKPALDRKRTLSSKGGLIASLLWFSSSCSCLTSVQRCAGLNQGSPGSTRCPGLEQLYTQQNSILSFLTIEQALVEHVVV